MAEPRSDRFAEAYSDAMMACISSCMGSMQSQCSLRHRKQQPFTGCHEYSFTEAISVCTKVDFCQKVLCLLQVLLLVISLQIDVGAVAVF